MKFSKTTKKVVSVAMAAAVVASSVAVPTVAKKADAASKYNAYLCFSSKSYKGVRANHNDANFKLGVFNGNKKSKIAGVSCKNATFKKGKFTFTVSVSGKGLKALKGEKGFNALYVDTSLPGTQKSKLSVSKLTIKIDGKTVKTIKKPALTPDPGKSDKFTQIMCVNSWNTYAEKKCKAASISKAPKKSISVTVTGKLK